MNERNIKAHHTPAGGSLEWPVVCTRWMATESGGEMVTQTLEESQQASLGRRRIWDLQKWGSYWSLSPGTQHKHGKLAV